MDDWSQTTGWAYSTPFTIPDGRYDVDFKAVNNVTGRPLTFSVVIDVKIDGHDFGATVYPADHTLRCFNYADGNIWLDGHFLTGNNYDTKEVVLRDNATDLEVYSYARQDETGTVISTSPYSIRDAEFVTLEVKYLDKDKNVQLFTNEFRVDSSCHSTDNFRLASASTEVSRPINR
ncbi:MAG: hypothetical protein WC045_00310 [Patescibacteria group bacterium]